MSFNPLHCGAVVASTLHRRAAHRRRAGLNPLHCGAVVASSVQNFRRRASTSRVSIPFIAGQWSLLISWMDAFIKACGVSIPFIAGQWSLRPAVGPLLLIGIVGFNPLHCGAVVASLLGPKLVFRNRRVSIPFIAGQWSLLCHIDGSGLICNVSIPFIAGQWSLLQSGSGGEDPAPPVSIPFIAGPWSLLAEERCEAYRRVDVSIPFIAGQWSLLSHAAREVFVQARRFNPLHCGAVVASWESLYCFGCVVTFQSPSLRGSGRFAFVYAFLYTLASFCFNPLHCGAVVASIVVLTSNRTRELSFQSPSLRGSGRFTATGGARTALRGVFQSPSLRGSGRFSMNCR